MKINNLTSWAHPWGMDSVVFLKWPTLSCGHSARRAFARSCRIQLFYSRVNPSHPGKRSLTGRMRFIGMPGCEPLTHRLRRSPLSQSKRSIFYGIRFCDFAFRLRAEWQGGVFSYDSEVYKKGAVDSAVSYDIILIFYGEDLYTRTVRYIWPWGLLKSKKTLYL